MRNLAIFDIDGTLTNTNAVDDECFLRAIADVFELAVERLDWSDAPHVTDSAITQWLSEQHRGRGVDDGELDRLVGVPVRVALARLHGEVVSMAMVLVVLVLVFVLHGLVGVRVLMPLGEVQPDARSHQQRSRAELQGEGLPE